MKITILLPYFGQFPNYFYLWLESAGKNPDFQFLVFHESEINYKVPDNVSIINITFSDIQKLIKLKLGRTCKIDTPYKLCDYKPAYGVIFSEFLVDTDWWGYCDADIIWGNLASFLKPELFSNFEKILTLGHLTLFRNTKKVNNAFKRVVDMPYTAFEAFHMRKNVAFDEIGGICLSKQKVYNTYDDRNSILDIWPHKFKFRTFDTEKKGNYFICEYNNGHIYANIVEDDKIVKKEYMYLHLQKRLMEINTTDTSLFFIIPNKIESIHNINISIESILDVNNYQEINRDHSHDKKYYGNLVEIFIEIKRRIRVIIYKCSHR